MRAQRENPDIQRNLDRSEIASIEARGPKIVRLARDDKWGWWNLTLTMKTGAVFRVRLSSIHKVRAFGEWE